VAESTTSGGRGRVIAMAGGGTGGHVYPALAMADALAARGHTMLYLGDEGRLEGRVVPQRGIPFHPVPALQYPRSGLVAKARFALGLLSSVLASRRMLRRLKVEMVVGVGGYISAPPVLAAWTLGIPSAIHEANVTPGMANKLCARVASQIMLTYEATAKRLPGSAPRTVVGCPVRPVVLTGDAAAARERYGLDASRPVVLVVGGSLGAKAINDLGMALARLDGRSFQVLHVTGPKYLEQVQQELGEPPEGVVLVGYEDKMQDSLAAADLVVARAGSSTLAEITVVGLPSVLVPSPNVTDNHQEGNARGLEAVGAAMVVVERDLDLQAAAADIAKLAADPDKLLAMGAAAKTLGRPDTAEQVADLVESVLNRA
jgi:UDP-N-acetylglucosamine--N-acetylmuramyl-(pentapeptide) pyrophosphoryl-undecaprenol N-acetylglucosamine transferase